MEVRFSSTTRCAPFTSNPDTHLPPPCPSCLQTLALSQSWASFLRPRWKITMAPCLPYLNSTQLLRAPYNIKYPSLIHFFSPSFNTYSSVTYSLALHSFDPKQLQSEWTVCLLDTDFRKMTALCDAKGCLGLTGFIQAMHEQIRIFTVSILANTSRHVANSRLSVLKQIPV